MSQEKLRILVLADSRAYHTARYIAELRRQDCQVLLASLERGKILHYQLKARGPIRAFHYVLSSTEIRAIIRRFQPDIVNPHFASGYGFSAALAQAKRFAPVFLNLWGSDILIAAKKSVFHQRKTSYALQYADAVTADSRYLLDEARKLGALRCGEVIPWGIEERFLRLHKPEYALHRPLRVIVPRQHDRIYNNPFLLRALAPLIDSGKITLTFGKSGPLYGQFRLWADETFPGKAQYYSHLARGAFLKLMAEHDVYLSGSLSDSSPVSLIEAMALGLVPVAADIAGVREWLNPKTGFLFSPHDAVQLQGIIGKLASNPDDLAALRQRNFERVRQEAVYEQNVGAMIALMRTLVGRRGRT